MNNEDYDIIVIGGSAGSIPIVSAILAGLQAEFSIPIVIVLHRQRNVVSEMAKIFEGKRMKVTEPEDKEAILDKHVYLAPQNYHLLVEKNKTFSLDYSEAVHFSRPSIDVTFESVSRVFENKTLVVLLSGANKDGSKGIEAVLSKNGKAIVQEPSTADYPLMVQSAIDHNNEAIVYTPIEIVNYISQIANR